MSTFEDIRTKVQNNLGRTDTNTNTIILASYNAIIAFMAVNFRWPDLEASKQVSFVAGTDEYVPKTWLEDTTFYKVLNIKVRGDATKWSAPLKRITPVKWDEQVKPVHHTTTSEPEYFMEFKNTWTFHPTPDDTYLVEVRYYKMPAEATGIADTVPFDQYLESVIVNATTGLCWSALEEINLANHFMGIAQILLKGVSDDAYTNLDFSAFISYAKGSRVSGTPWLDPFQKV
jgi:transcriptional regulator of met regulon